MYWQVFMWGFYPHNVYKDKSFAIKYSISMLSYYYVCNRLRTYVSIHNICFFMLKVIVDQKYNLQ